MGSLAVLAMVDQVNPTASHSEGHHLHPLFQARRRASQTPPTKDRAESAQTSICSFDGARDEETHGKRDGPQRKRQKLEPRVLEDEEKQQLKKCNKASLGGTIMDHFTRLDRGHASSPSTNDESKQQNGEEQDGEDEEGKGLDRPEGDPKPRLEPETTHGNRVTPAPYQTLASTLNPDPPMPKKVIRLNLKTGTLGSPPKPRPTPARVEHETEATKKVSPNGRGKKTRSRIVRIRYDTDAESRMRIGAKVNAILHGPHALSTGSPNTTNSQPSDTSPESKKPVDQELPKTTHPFFLGQSKPPKSTSGPVDVKPEPTDLSSAKVSSSTPCSPNKVRPISHNTRLPQFGVKSIGLKVPGSKLPAWPWKDMVHIRGDDSLVSCQSDEPTLTFSSRKSKGRAVEISTRESVMEYITKRIDIPTLTDAVRNANTDDFLPPPAEIRLPQKHFESGSKLQHRILPQLRCSKQKKAVGEKDAAGKANILEHPPQLIRLFNSIQSELPAVDRSECETLSWAQKYAPVCAAEILQPGREAFFLKEWLQALMVQSVDTGPGDGEKSKGSLSKSKPSGPAKKRRKKKLDDFIVSSDEEADQMDEVSETETDWVASGTYGIVRKTVIRAGDLRAKGSKDSSRLTNTVVISGPHGCGKTAAVYAVAKELGFEVFEINSSSRRSGKDVLERIGDMTRNHLVSHQQRSNPETREETEEAPVDEGAAEDIKSGKQSTMISFFKPKATVDSSKKTTNPPSGGPPRKEAKKESPKGQKQSLILLEEADILFEEDKQFWASVIGLIAQSKRPFIVTCNDETLLPLQTLNLHGIFRLSHPPTDLAVDRLILIAANEGHSLRRDAVEALFESRNRDLRAATMDLNYWCQIGVGDRRGGFEWFYLRWPKGIDLDENDEVVRVVSEDTYQPGMNWLVRDHVMDNLVHPGMAEEELLQQVWNSWNVDVGHWQSSTGLAPWAESLSTVTSEASGRLAALEAFDRFAEVMSASDICSCKAFARFQEVRWPPLSFLSP